MFSNPSRPVLLRSILLVTAALSLLAVWDLIGLAERLGVDLRASLNWMGMLTALSVLAVLALLGVAVRFSKAAQGLWSRFAVDVWSRGIPQWVGIPLLSITLVFYSLFTFSPIGALMNSALWARLLEIPQPLLYGGILVFATLGTYSLNSSVFDVGLMYLIGLAGFFMRRFDIPVAPAIIAMILGPMAEQQFRRALAISQGDATVFLRHPLSATLIALSVLVMIVPPLLQWIRRSANRTVSLP